MNNHAQCTTDTQPRPTPRRLCTSWSLALVCSALFALLTGCEKDCPAGSEADGGALPRDASTSADASDSGPGSQLDSGHADGAVASTCPARWAVDDAYVASGFCASVFAIRLHDPRGIEVAANGDVLVVERALSRIVALFDDDDDGRSGPLEQVVLASVAGLNHGIRIHGAYLYASTSTEVYRWGYATGARAPLGTPERVVSGIPGGGRHQTRSLVFDTAGRLYVQVGSETNVDDTSERAQIRRFDLSIVPDGGIPFGSGELFADGIRNAVALGLDGDGRIWALDNGVDDLAREDLGGDLHEDNPAEEILRLDTTGGFYGYPYCWTELAVPEPNGQGAGTQWAHPGFLADGTHDDAWCRDRARVIPPIGWLPVAHSAPLDLAFYEAEAFPADYRGDMFVALHGSWNRTAPAGYELVHVEMTDGTPSAVHTFFGYGGDGKLSAQWPHRPVGVRVGPDGALYVSSDASGVVFRIASAPASRPESD